MVKIYNTNTKREMIFDDTISAMNFAIRRYRFYEEVWKIKK